MYERESAISAPRSSFQFRRWWWGVLRSLLFLLLLLLLLGPCTGPGQFVSNAHPSLIHCVFNFARQSLGYLEFHSSSWKKPFQVLGTSERVKPLTGTVGLCCRCYCCWQTNRTARVEADGVPHFLPEIGHVRKVFHTKPNRPPELQLQIIQLNFHAFLFHFRDRFRIASLQWSKHTKKK